MARAVFRVDLPSGVWVGDISRSYPEVTFRILSAFPGEDSGYGLLELVGEEAAAVAEAVADSDAVEWVERIHTGEERIVLQFETTELPLLLTVQQAQIPLEFPVELLDGTIDMELVAPRERISAFDEQLSALSIPHRLDRIYRDVEQTDPLTENQRELLLEALERGYYDTPREITLTDLAGELDMAPSTLSETLHRAEGTVIREFAAEHFDADREAFTG